MTYLSISSSYPYYIILILFNDDVIINWSDFIPQYILITTIWDERS